MFFKNKENDDLQNNAEQEEVKNQENKDNPENNQDNAQNSLQDELNKTKERYQYLAAEFDNYRRRYDKEKATWITQAHSQIIKDVLPIIDDFERALGLQDKDLSQETQAYLKGFEIILKEMNKLLEKYQVQEIKPQVEFDPYEHEAVMQVASEERESGQIVQVLQKGYKIKDQVLRAAKVSVAV